MKTGVVGAGYVGSAVAELAVWNGHQVMVGNSRDPNTLFSLVGTIGRGTRAGTVKEVAVFGEIIILAIPLRSYLDLPRVIIDANNYYPERGGNIEELDTERPTTSELIARHLAGAQQVKALNSIPAAHLAEGGALHGSDSRRALPIAGDHPIAKDAVTKLLTGFGFAVVDAGALSEGWRFQRDTPSYCVPLDAVGLRAALDGCGRATAVANGNICRRLRGKRAEERPSAYLRQFLRSCRCRRRRQVLLHRLDERRDSFSKHSEPVSCF